MAAKWFALPVGLMNPSASGGGRPSALGRNVAASSLGTRDAIHCLKHSSEIRLRNGPGSGLDNPVLEIGLDRRGIRLAGRDPRNRLGRSWITPPILSDDHSRIGSHRGPGPGPLRSSCGLQSVLSQHRCGRSLGREALVTSVTGSPVRFVLRWSLRRGSVLALGASHWTLLAPGRPAVNREASHKAGPAPPGASGRCSASFSWAQSPREVPGSG